MSSLVRVRNITIMPDEAGLSDHDVEDALINVDQIIRIEPWYDGGFIIFMSDNSRVIVNEFPWTRLKKPIEEFAKKYEWIKG